MTLETGGLVDNGGGAASAALASWFHFELQQRFIARQMLFRCLTSVTTRGAKVRFYLIPKLQLPPFR